MCEEMKLSATNFGFDGEWIADVVEKYGDDAVAVIVEAARSGLSVKFVIELIDRFGTQVLELLVNVLNQFKMTQMAATGVVVEGPIVEGVNSALTDVLIKDYLPMIIEKLLPQIMEKYGPQLIQLVVDWLLKSLQK